VAKDPNDNVIDASAAFGPEPGAVSDAVEEPTEIEEGGTPNIRALAQDESMRDPTIAEQLVGLADGAELFHVDQVAYASVIVDGHRETWRVGSKAMGKYLSHRYFEQTKRIAGAQAVADAIRTLEGKAVFGGAEGKVYIRIANVGDVVYLDLADRERRVARIDRQGWSIVTDPPVRFVRPRGVMPLPQPVAGGSLEELRPLVNIRTEPLWRLVVAWLVSALFPGPYTYLVLFGQQGSAKTSTSRNLRFVADPNKSSVRAQPKNVHDLVIAAMNSVFIVLDNISYIEEWLSDALCRMSTGGGFSTRELFTDQDEVIIDVQRPGILNGITDIVARGDLLDRSILIELPSIADDERKTQVEMDREFEAAWPRVLGALLDAVSGVIRFTDSVNLELLPRMADFARRGVALERALRWPEGSFMEAYRSVMSSAHAVALDASPLAHYVRELAESGWQGTASELLAEVNAMLDGRGGVSQVSAGPFRAKPRPKGWPGSAHVLSNHLRRLEPNLRAFGVEIEFIQTQGAGSRKLIAIRRVAAQCRASLALNPPPVPGPWSATPMSVQRCEQAGTARFRGHPPRLYAPTIVAGAPQLPPDVEVDDDCREDEKRV
jgi:hypothetical protein